MVAHSDHPVPGHMLPAFSATGQLQNQ